MLFIIPVGISVILEPAKEQVIFFYYILILKIERGCTFIPILVQRHEAVNAEFITILSKVIITTVMIVQSLSVAYDNKRALC